MFDGFPIARWQRVTAWILAGLVAFFLAAPSLVVLPMSFSGSDLLEFPPSSLSLRWYDTYAASPEWVAATIVSAKLGSLTALISVPVGFLAAYGSRALPRRLRTLVSGIVLLPALVPAILLGIGLYFLLAKLKLVGTLTGVLIGHVALALPVAYVILTAGFQQFDATLELAAYSLGASRPQTLAFVVLPQLAYSIVVASVLAFLTSLDEVVVAMLISGGDNSTLPKVMFAALKDKIDPTIGVVSSGLLVVATIVTLLLLARDAKTPAT